MSSKRRRELVKLMLSHALRSDGIHQFLTLTLSRGAEIEIALEQMVPHAAGRS